ncbi:hypothetical protein Q7C36_023327 [Tachysurus vachellii]|uniref:Uncharacterized protein n=1 Tax=Tachysurus vachellii TaxID=175792 RepID=A0AA88IM69_TACVA|nr:hypothetical protein Q7C36_023327 [Tachysurus vachellii]
MSQESKGKKEEKKEKLGLRAMLACLSLSPSKCQKVLLLDRTKADAPVSVRNMAKICGYKTLTLSYCISDLHNWWNRKFLSSTSVPQCLFSIEPKDKHQK